MRAFRYRVGFLVLVIALMPAARYRSALGAESIANCPPKFVGEYPADFEGDWTDNVQGLTHDDTHWYLTQTLDIFRIPVGRDFAQDHEGAPGVAHRDRDSYPELAAYDHFGDISFFNGYVLLAVDTGPPQGALALLRGDDTLDLVDVEPFPGQTSAGWVAAGPDGFVYSSVSGATEFRKYSVNWDDVENNLVVTFVEAIPLTDENGDPYQLFDMQGGVVTPDNKVIIVSNGFDDCDNATYGLHTFNLQTGQRIIRSCQSGCDFAFLFDPCDFGILDEEPEGMTIWDLDDGAAPGMSGQLHVLLLNNDILTDNNWMKHYDLDTTPPEVVCPQSITVECSAHDGTPATDSTIVAFLNAAIASDNCDDTVDITHDAPDFFDMGTTTVTFTATDDIMANQATCTADVTVVDTTAPVLDVSLNRDVLWPPNHKMADIEATVEVTDVCDEGATFTLLSVVSDEPDDDKGDGHTANDIAGAQPGTGDTTFQLRSERQGTGDGREYTIIYCASDVSGNVACDTVTVRVPHDQSGAALAADGFALDGKQFAPEAPRFALVIPSVRGALDAGAIDASRVYVGNTTGALRPRSTQLLDTNHDGLKDLIAYYETGSALLLAGLEASNAAGGVAEIRRLEPVGLHYTSPDGTDYLVASIFDLGAPVALQPTAAPGSKLLPVLTTTGRALATSLLGVHPNPFNPTTTVQFELASPARVRVRVYDVQGMLVRTLLDEDRAAGEHAINWDGRDNQGHALASGIYFMHMSAGLYQTTRKVVMLK
jgi:hypothetical protein